MDQIARESAARVARPAYSKPVESALVSYRRHYGRIVGGGGAPMRRTGSEGRPAGEPGTVSALKSTLRDRGFHRHPKAIAALRVLERGDLVFLSPRARKGSGRKPLNWKNFRRR